MLCTAHKRNGDPCGQDAMRGGFVCWMHGGKQGKVMARASVRAELQAWRLDDATAEPGEVMLRLVTQSAARAELYASLLGEAYAQAETEGEGSFTDMPAGVSALIGHKYALTKDGDRVAVGEAIRGLALLERDERELCASFAAKAIAAGLAERMVRIAERQAEVIVEVIRAALGSVEGLTAEQIEAVERAAGKELRAITA